MHISGLGVGHGEVASRYRKEEEEGVALRRQRAVATATAPESRVDVASHVASGQARLYREIFGQYDVTAITPRDFSQMLRQLEEGDVITGADREELSLLRQDLDRAGVEADEPLDLVLYLEIRLDQQAQRPSSPHDGTAMSTGNDQVPAPPRRLLRRQLEWMQKFATAAQLDGFRGVDTTV